MKRVRFGRGVSPHSFPSWTGRRGPDPPSTSFFPLPALCAENFSFLTHFCSKKCPKFPGPDPPAALFEPCLTPPSNKFFASWGAKMAKMGKFLPISAISGRNGLANFCSNSTSFGFLDPVRHQQPRSGLLAWGEGAAFSQTAQFFKPLSWAGPPP